MRSSIGGCWQCAAVLLLSLQPSADAEPIDGERRFSPIAVTSSRTTANDEDVAYVVHVLSRSDLDASIARTVPESISMLPGVLIQKSAPGHGSPYIRGFTGNRTLTVIDGIRYNNATFRDGANEYFAQIDPFTLDRVEIISGPASVLYGSEAVGGTINLATRASDFQSETGPFAEATQTFRYGAGDSSRQSRTGVVIGRGQTWGFRLGGSIKDHGDVRAAELGRLPETDYSETGQDIRFDAMASENWVVTLARFAIQQDDVPRTHTTIFSEPFLGTQEGTDLVRRKDHTRSLNYAKISGAAVSKLVDHIDLTLSFQPRTETEIVFRQNGSMTNQSFESGLAAFNAVFQSSLDPVSFVYGLDVSRERVTSARVDLSGATGARRVRIQGPVGDDSEYEQVGLFFSSHWPAEHGVTYDFGARLSRISARVGRFEDPATGASISYADEWTNFSGSARVSFAPNPNTTIWAGASQSFRAPNLADISRFGNSRSNEFEVASFDLKPERFLTFDTGLRYASEEATVSVTAYHTHLIDYIDTIPTGRLIDGLTEVSKRNSSSGFVRGVEIEGKLIFPYGFDATANATWLEGELTRPLDATTTAALTEPISRIQPVTANFALNWSRLNFELGAELSLVGRADQLSAADRADLQRIPPGGTPGYTLLNFRTSWDLNDRIALSVRLNNALGEAYRTHGSGSNEPGRHIVAELSLTL